jgi:hypothetical protein
MNVAVARRALGIIATIWILTSSGTSLADEHRDTAANKTN